MPFVLLALALTAAPEPDALRLVRRAMVEYSLNEWGDAFLDYQAAYDLDPIPELLFDMGQCQRGLHHWERAEFLFRRYLSERPDAGNRARVEAFISELQDREQQEQAPLPSPQELSENPPPAVGPAPKPEGPSAVPGTPPGDAVALSRKATLAYNASEFGEAFLDYQAAYEIDAVPELTFDMAQCQRGLHHWDRAEALYRRYLLERPNASNRARVEALILQMEQHRQLDLATAAQEQKVEDQTTALGKQPTATAIPGLPSKPGINLEADVAPEKPPKEGPDGGKYIPPGVYVAGGIGALCLLGAAGLGLAVLAQPDSTVGAPPLHRLTYPQLQAVNAEGETAVGLAIGGAVLVGTSALFAFLAK